jgi:hypothetical protein
MLMRNSFLNRCFRILPAVGFVLLLVQPVHAADPLQFFQNYFITGDYAAKGVGVRQTGQLDPVTGRSLAHQIIEIPTCVQGGSTLECVPADGTLIGALFYWETLEKTGLASSAMAYARNPHDLDPNVPAPPLVNCNIPQDNGQRCVMLGKPIGNDHVACWSGGGSTGASNGAAKLQVYRADVLRFLPVVNGKRVPRLEFWVSDSGSNGNGVPLTEGGSLVVIYSNPSLPFKGVVIFDGSYTINNNQDSMVQPIDGFYQTTTSPDAKVTHIVGDGQLNFSENLWFGDGNSASTLLATNPFVGSAAPQGSNATSGFSWDTLTYNVGAGGAGLVGPGSGLVTTKVDHTGNPFDCLSWGAIVFSTTVQDVDQDGLVDLWETAGYRDRTRDGWAPIANVIPLNSMGAVVGQKDLFVEVDHHVRYNANGSLNHSEQPTVAMLNMVGAALTKPADLNLKIHVHFDAGPGIVPPNGTEFIIGSNQGPLEGGDAVNERNKAFYCGETADTDKCAFPGQPGLLRWPKSILEIQHAFKPASDPKYLPGDSNYVKGNATNSRQYSTDDRRHWAHYVFAGHQLAMRDPNQTGVQNGQFVGFRARTVSGRSNLPGRISALTTGGWTSISETGRAGTLLHELAHSMSLTHKGTPAGLNCNPNRQGVVNYANQLGFYNEAGALVIGLSNQILTGQSGKEDEGNLFESAALTATGGVDPLKTDYRLRYYALRDNVEKYLGLDKLNNVHIQKAKRHCDGTELNSDGLGGVTDLDVVRVDRIKLGTVSPVSLGNIDWNFDGVILDGNPGDINFNGKPTKTNPNIGESTAVFGGSNDFLDIIARHGLQQIDVGPNVFGLSRGVEYTDLLTPNDPTDIGADEIGADEIGADEIGADEIGADEIGADEIGADEIGADEIGADEIGADEIGLTPDIDETQAALSGGNAPSGITTQVFGQGNNKGILLKWTAPTGATAVTIVRSQTISTSSDTVTSDPPVVVSVPANNVSVPTQPAPNYLDTAGLKNNTRYRYTILATFPDPTPGSTDTVSSGPSDPAFQIFN